MDTAIKIGAEVSKETSKNLGDLIDKVFSSAAKSRMEQEAIRQALSLIERGLSVHNTTVANCVINGEKTVNT